ncbi:unnamed protein product [Danaus chrysippus]|uniref:(African queen) hypothetical protein n=1 Tax=Danaus chrysippus TaxID=151541 RepID=A0A8J2QWL2_9NEOP|nr:unnamed protein product [Danaus chrysippus]
MERNLIALKKLMARGKMNKIEVSLKGKGHINDHKEVTKHQSNIKEILLNSNATPIRCRGGIGYACCFCTEQFPIPADLKKHTHEEHSDEEKAKFMKDKDMHGFIVKLDVTGMRCKLCDQEIKELEKMIDHLGNVHGKKVYTDLKNHILPFHFPSEILECIICCNVFNTFKALQEHMNLHYRNFICNSCNAGFVNKNILLRHGDAHKTGTFPCDVCEKTFDTARKRQLHSRAKHPGEILPHKCGYCDERFPEVRKKYEHLSKEHGIKNPSIKCKACGKVFDKKQSWRMHTTRVHLMERNHKCTECVMKFYTRRELDNHMVKHTGTRNFKCDVCSKQYGRYKTLREHFKRAHS